MNESLMAFILGLTLGTGIIVSVASIRPEHTVPYKQGQIDALNGKILFELKKQEDGTIQWTRIEK